MKNKIKENKLLINQKKKKNEERQHTWGWEEKRLLDFSWEEEREEKRTREKRVCERKRRKKKMKPCLFWFWYFNLVSSMELPRTFHFVSKVKWKFLTFIKSLRKLPPNIIDDFLLRWWCCWEKKRWTIKRTLIISALRSKQFSWWIEYDYR